MHFRKNERLAVFINGANLSAAVSALDLDIDFQGISRFFREKCNLVRIYSYAALPNEKASIRQLLDGLEYYLERRQAGAQLRRGRKSSRPRGFWR